MSRQQTHTGIVVTKDEQKTAQLHETETIWCIGQHETYDKFTGHGVGELLTRCRRQQIFLYVIMRLTDN